MLNKSIKFFLDHKIFAYLLLAVLLLWGLRSLPLITESNWVGSDPVAIDAIPDIGENQQIVFTKWPGRSPRDIEDQITYPLTSSLLGIPGVKTVRSSSMFGFSSIYVIFEEDIDFYWSRSRILEKLNSLSDNLLPAGVAPALGPDATALGQVFWYTLEGRSPQGKPTGGWSLGELRSIQDYFVKYALASASGVSEVASIGGFVQEYQIDVDPEALKVLNVTLSEVARAVQQSNRDVGAQTLEINSVEYLVRGLGYVQSIDDLENVVLRSDQFKSIRVGDVAKVSLGPAERRGMLDKEGVEVVGGVVVARYGANPLQVIGSVKDKLGELSVGLPSKTLADGTVSQLTVVPFYDRSGLIYETLDTLSLALILEILITILIVVVMVYNLRASMLISGLLPVAILFVFIAMKLFGVDANIVALSGIAIAIGTMVDLGVILSENILNHLENLKAEQSVDEVVYTATTEVSGALVTAVFTTIISFIPVFTLTGAEGKLFSPLAFTKTFALLAAVVVTLFLIPTFAVAVFKRPKKASLIKLGVNIGLAVLGVAGLIYGYWAALVLLVFAALQFLTTTDRISEQLHNRLNIGLTVFTILGFLAHYWRPLGFDRSLVINYIFVAFLCAVVLVTFYLFKRYYSAILGWALSNKLTFLSLPLALLLMGYAIMRNTPEEFMPSLNEGSFLLMPTSMPHAGVSENRRILQQLDRAVAAIPEVETVVGKSGRIESALDPAPLSMFENVIQYYPEYQLNAFGKPQRYKVNQDGLFVLSSAQLAYNPNHEHKLDSANQALEIVDGLGIDRSLLIADKDGAYFRNWRPDIQSTDDIWNEIVSATAIAGVTSAPKLQPIETRLVMLQSGMRAPMGIKVKGQDLEQIEQFGLQLESALKSVEGVKTSSVFADRIVGKPYLLIDIDREGLVRYGLRIEDVERVIELALGGMPVSQSVEGRERYSIRVRYPRELRNSVADIEDIYVDINANQRVRLGQLADIRFEKGPQAIKSEDTFLVGYVLFDKAAGYAEVEVVESAQSYIQEQIRLGAIEVPSGVSYAFVGTYENQLRAARTLSIVVPLALAIIFLILYVQFKSVSTSLMVFSGIAVAFAGGFILIGLYSQPWFLNFSFFGENLRELFQIGPVNLSVAVWVGFIALFGIATDDGVLMATYLTQSFRGGTPKTVQEIRSKVIEAGERRIRPCLMTTATTLLALLPILTSTGKGSDIMIPMAIPSFGGMLIALITLFIVPVLYSYRQEWQLKNTKNER
ncbi:MAG: efflux RND transporter permease subunit [Flavobacteriaceae bacterium]